MRTLHELRVGIDRSGNSTKPAQQSPHPKRLECGFDGKCRREKGDDQEREEVARRRRALQRHITNCPIYAENFTLADERFRLSPLRSSI